MCIRDRAYAEAMMPTVDELETIKNVWHKPYTEMRDHDTFRVYCNTFNFECTVTKKYVLVFVCVSHYTNTKQPEITN